MKKVGEGGIGCQLGSSHSRSTRSSKLEARGKGSSTPSIIKSDTGRGRSVTGKDANLELGAYLLTLRGGNPMTKKGSCLQLSVSAMTVP